jgi:hypothetical protein
MPERDPREDKIRSYQHDRRNVYGESDKGSRKAIRFRKAWVNRTYRRAVHEHLQFDDTPEDLHERATQVPRKFWKKVPDAPLGDVVKSRLARRGNEGTPADESALRKEAHRRGKDKPHPWAR